MFLLFVLIACLLATGTKHTNICPLLGFFLIYTSALLFQIQDTSLLWRHEGNKNVYFCTPKWRFHLIFVHLNWKGLGELAPIIQRKPKPRWTIYLLYKLEDLSRISLWLCLACGILDLVEWSSSNLIVWEETKQHIHYWFAGRCQSRRFFGVSRLHNFL